MSDLDPYTDLMVSKPDIPKSTSLDSSPRDNVDGSGEREPEPSSPVSSAVRNDDQGQAGAGSRARYVAERGCGSAGTAYNRLDWEVLDRARSSGRQLLCRATRADALLIATSMNLTV